MFYLYIVDIPHYGRTLFNSKTHPKTDTFFPLLELCSWYKSLYTISVLACISEGNILPINNEYTTQAYGVIANQHYDLQAKSFDWLS